MGAERRSKRSKKKSYQKGGTTTATTSNLLPSWTVMPAAAITCCTTATITTTQRRFCSKKQQPGGKRLLLFLIFLLVLIPMSIFGISYSSRWTTISTATTLTTTKVSSSKPIITKLPNQFPPQNMIFFIRMSGSRMDHIERFICSLLRSILLFWNIQYTNQILLVLDDEKQTDHEFGMKMKQQFQYQQYQYQQNQDQQQKDQDQHNYNAVPSTTTTTTTATISSMNKNATNNINNNNNFYQLHVEYEPLPKPVKKILQQHGGPEWLPLGYKRQLWSSFFSDIYLKDDNDNNKKNRNANNNDTPNDNNNDEEDDEDDDNTLLVFMDNDAMFVSPVTIRSIFDMTTKRPRVYGTDCTFLNTMVLNWRYTAQQALGLPIIADFMIYFPVYIYRDTITHCRNYILQRFNVSTMEDAYPKFMTNKTQISPITILLNYAWHYERYRYTWSFANCNYHSYIVPKEDIIPSQYLHERVPVPQTAFHQTYAMGLTKLTHVGYCLATQSTEKYLPPECLQLPHDDDDDEENSSWLWKLFQTKKKKKKPLYTWKDQYVLFYHDLQRLQERTQSNPCIIYGDPSIEQFCQSQLKQQYMEYKHEVQQEHRIPINWYQTEQVINTMTKEWNLTCRNLQTGYDTTNGRKMGD